MQIITQILATTAAWTDPPVIVGLLGPILAVCIADVLKRLHPRR